MNRRSTWSGHITFGINSIPVKAYTIVDEDKGSMLHLYHTDCGKRISMPRMCTACNVRLQTHEVSDGFDGPDGSVLLSQSDMNAIYPPRPHVLAIRQFSYAEDIDPIMLDKPYYVVAEPGFEKAFSGLLTALRESGKVAVGEIALRGPVKAVVARPGKGALAMHVLRWGDSIREFEAEEFDSTPELIKEAHEAVENMTYKFDASEWTNDKKRRLEKLMQEKLS